MATEVLKIDLKIETGDSKAAIAEIRNLWKTATGQMKEDASGLTAHKKAVAKEAEAAIKAAARAASQAEKEAAKDAAHHASRVAREVLRAKKEAKKEEVDAARKAAAANKAITDELKRYGTRAFLAIRDQAVEAFRAIAKESFKLAVDFETNMTMISTLLDDAVVPRMGEIADRLLQIGSRTSQSLNDLSKSLYLAISSGVTDLDRALELTEVAAKSASAGGTETKVSVDGMTTALNVWGKEAGNAEVIASQMFKTVVWAKTTYAQLASSLGTVASAAGMANVKTNELFGAYVAMTRAGNKTASSMTYLQNLIVKLLVPTRQAKEEFQKLGIEYGEHALATKGLSGMIEDIKQKTGGSTEALWRLTGQMRAYRALVVLAGKGNKDFVESTQDIKNSTDDLNKKYAEVEKTFTHQWKVLRSTLEEVGVRMWQEALPQVTKWVQGISEWLKQNQIEVIEWGKTFVANLQDVAHVLAGIIISLQETARWIGEIPVVASAWRGIKAVWGAVGEDASAALSQKSREARLNAEVARRHLEIFTRIYKKGGADAERMDAKLKALEERLKYLNLMAQPAKRDQDLKASVERDIAALKKAREVAEAHGRLTRPKVLTEAERAEQAEGVVEKAEEQAAQAFNRAKSTERTRLETWYKEQENLLKAHLAKTKMSREDAQALRDRLEAAYEARKARLPVSRKRAAREDKDPQVAAIVRTFEQSRNAVLALERVEGDAYDRLATRRDQAILKHGMFADFRLRIEKWYSAEVAKLDESAEKKLDHIMERTVARRYVEARRVIQIARNEMQERQRVEDARLKLAEAQGPVKAETRIGVEAERQIAQAKFALQDLQMRAKEVQDKMRIGVLPQDLGQQQIDSLNKIIGLRQQEIILIGQTKDAQIAGLSVSSRFVRTFAQEASEYNARFASTLTSMANTAVSNIGNGISRAFEVIVTGQGNAGAEMGKMFLDTLAGMAAQLGAFYMTAGFAALWVPPYTGAASIAGGAALMALSGLLKGASSLVGATASTPSTGTGSASVGKVPSVGSPDTAGARVPGQRMSRDGGGVVQFNFLVEADPFSGETRQQKLRRIRGFFDTETRAAGMANPFALAERMGAKAVGR